METPPTHVEVRHWERIPMTEYHPGETVWSARIFHGVEGSTYHRDCSWDSISLHLYQLGISSGSRVLSEQLAELGVTYSVIRVGRKADLL